MTTLEARVRERLKEFQARIDAVPRLEAEMARLRTQGVTETDAHMKALVSELEDARMASTQQVEYLLKSGPYIESYNAIVDEDAAPASSSAPKAPVGAQTGGMDEFVNIRGMHNKQKVFHEYLIDVEGYPPDLAGAHYYKKDDHEKDNECDMCSQTLVLENSQAMLICTACGFCKPCIEMTSANLTFEQETTRDLVTSFSYKRLNHFTEWLSSLTCKRTSTEIPQEVLDAVRMEFKKARATQRGDIKPAKVREYLKKLQQQRYYEHMHQICAELHGTPPPQISADLEKKLRSMFLEIQAPFAAAVAAVCPKRKNFLSYSYVLYKFCQLLGHDDLCKHFPLLKSTQKLYTQDMIWRVICQNLEWEFVPSL